ncbi:thioredoxin [Candidatus Parvarchaeota archaeon]|nr:thioredoxin [Candidatus Parvarchaeota archaeon]
MVMELNSQNFKEEVGSKGFVLVDFWAPWCGPCRMLGPVIESLSETMKGKLKFAKLNVDDEGEIAGAFGVMSIPAIILFKDGKAIAQRTGAAQADAMKKWIEETLAK